MARKPSLFSAYLNFKVPRAFGVDLNNDTIKVFQINQKGSYHQVSGWGRTTLSKGIIDNYEIKQPDAFGELFHETIRSANGKIKGKGLMVSIPENKVFTRLVTVPMMDEKEAAETVKWETESNIPIPIDDVYFDWQIVETGKDSMKILVMACPKKIIENYLVTFRDIGFEVVGFEAVSIASGRSVVPAVGNAPILLVDLGAENTSLAIYHNGFPLFSSSGSVCGKMMTDAIAKHLGISEEKADSYKRKIGLGSNLKEKNDIMAILQPVLSSLALDIEKTISFFEDTLMSAAPERIEISNVLLCGGGSNMKGLAAFLAVQLQKPIQIANPWENVQIGRVLPPISKEEAQSYITAIGLALRAYEYENYH